LENSSLPHVYKDRLVVLDKKCKKNAIFIFLHKKEVNKKKSKKYVVDNKVFLECIWQIDYLL